MAGTIVVDRLESDASYASSINIASPVIVSNTFAFPAGSNTAPAISPTGDTNTGIFFPAADTIAFAEGGVEAMRIDSSGNLQFNSGYGSVVTAYGCRAWVNFDGTNNSANLTGTYSQSGTTVTVTATAHELIVGSSVFADITSGTGVDGTYTVVTVTDANTFTYTAGTSLTTSGNVTLRRNTIRASGNITSITDNGTGDYSVNFSAAMPDTNYSVAGVAGTLAANTSSSMHPKVYNTGSVQLFVGSAAGAAADRSNINIAIFR